MRVEALTPRMTAIAEILVCSSVPTQVLIASILRMAGWMPFDEAGQLSLPFVVALSIAVNLFGAITFDRIPAFYDDDLSQRRFFQPD